MFTTAITHKMPFKIVSQKYAKLNSSHLEYISTKVDNFRSEIVYYSFKRKNFDNIVNAKKRRCEVSVF